MLYILRVTRTHSGNNMRIDHSWNKLSSSHDDKCSEHSCSKITIKLMQPEEKKEFFIWIFYLCKNDESTEPIVIPIIHLHQCVHIYNQKNRGNYSTIYIWESHRSFPHMPRNKHWLLSSFQHSILCSCYFFSFFLFFQF